MTALNTEENRARLRRSLQQAEPLVLEEVHPNPETFDFDQQTGVEVCFIAGRAGSDTVGLLVSGDLQYRGGDPETVRMFESAGTERGWKRLAHLRTQNPSTVLRETARLLEVEGHRPSDTAPDEHSSSDGERVVVDGELKEDSQEEDRFVGTDLVRLARDEELRTVIGREEEVQALLRIISKREKNAACLVGRAGVGKTAVVEKLAIEIASNRLPDQLHISQLLSVNLGFLAAGATAKNQLEGRFKQILDTARENPKVVLFLDEIHMLRGKNDVSQMVKEDLGRGTIRLIGATTPGEYRSIEEDPALKRRFQKVPVAEPTREQAIDILKGVRKEIEAHHSVAVPDELLEDIVVLSDRFVPDRQLPDKAIDLLDEAAARRALDAERRLLPSPPAEFAEEPNSRQPRDDESKDTETFDELITQND